MTLPGETIGTGAPTRCPDCGVMPPLRVHMSAAGYYIGAYCNCGPYCRESGYYRSREAAERAFRIEGYEERS
jgi:hypothetical protein